MANKRAYNVDPYYKPVRSTTNFCNEPQALVNICLNCPLPTCNPTTCKRYKMAEIRWKCGVYPLVDLEPVAPIKPLPKCKQCYFGRDKEFCPLIRGTCVKEDYNA